ncbi:hypothetical protein [Halalkalibacter okhensis]|uniref:Uncharacterized protein n=1 Tax=Halalkalibacter okhensis TaxID=333138 RepID=A0A0B0I5U3_9BACI|nr:hypothetical protein [Halalkalibacter okhensis]KHF37803.1 hypothetical protein LQ50_25260 [Halalkalibacter okhensis]
MILAVIIEKFCAETNQFTLKVKLNGSFTKGEWGRLKEYKKCLEISEQCLLVRYQNTIVHLYHEKDMCLVANSKSISEGIKHVENIIEFLKEGALNR